VIADRWIAHIDNRLEYERVMLADAGGIAAERIAPEKGGACRCWASPRGGWSYIQKVNKVSMTVLDNWGNRGANFTRTIPFDKLGALMSKTQVEEKRAAGLLAESADKTGFFISMKNRNGRRRGRPGNQPRSTPCARRCATACRS
jgi:hypothetical protein